MIRTVFFVQDKDYDGLNPVQFGYQKCKPLHLSDRDPRDHWLYHFVVSGKGVFKFKDTTYNLSENDLFCIPPHEKFFYQADQDEPWEYIWICFKSSKELPIPFIPVIHCPQAAQIFITMKNHIKNYSLGQNAYLSGKLWQLMAVILENDNSYSSYTKQALSYIYTNFNSPNLSISSIAEANGLTRSHLFRVFKNDIGVSPSKYIMNLRIEKAKEILKETSTPIAEVAASVGYQNIFYFSKIFKQKTGLAPGKYKKHNKLFTEDSDIPD